MRMRRKGQFFIISSVIVVLFLLAVSDILAHDTSYNPSEQQKDIDETLWNLKSFETEMQAIILVSSADNLENNLNAYLLEKKDDLNKNGYFVEYFYNASKDNLWMMIERDNVRIEKEYYIEPTSIVSVWDFNEGIGVVAKDKYNINSGRLYNFDWTEDSGWTENCISEDCLSFDGVDDIVEVADSDTLDFTDEITIEVWVRLNSTGIAQNIVAKNSVGITPIWCLKIWTDNKVYFHGKSLSPKVIGSNATLSTGRWYHLVVMWNGTVTKIYINGIEDTSESQTGTLDTNTELLTIGAGDLSGAVTFPFKGSIDRVRIYNHSLSAEKAMFLYNNRLI